MWPYLRLAVGRDHDDHHDRGTVILDAQQVWLLRDDLTDWLDRARKTKP